MLSDHRNFTCFTFICLGPKTSEFGHTSERSDTRRVSGKSIWHGSGQVDTGHNVTLVVPVRSNTRSGFRGTENLGASGKVQAQLHVRWYSAQRKKSLNLARVIMRKMRNNAKIC